MSSAVTTEGQTRINQLRGAEQPLVIDRMVLALIPGLDPTAPVDRNQQMPDPGQIVHTQTIDADHKGYVTPDQVVYSIILGSDQGNFSFNWIGTLEKDTNKVITVTTTPETPKRKTDLATNTTGNNITRNVMLAFQDAQNLTAITVTAQTWQFNYTAQITAHAELLVDPTQEGTDKKHLTNTQAKKWEDHGKNNSVHLTPEQKAIWDNHAAAKDNPHAVSQAQIGYTAADVLTKLLTVHGAGTGLDADKLDGKHAADFTLAATAFKGIVTQRSTRTTGGTWTITGLTIGKPLIIGVKGTVNNFFTKIYIISGANIGRVTNTSKTFILSGDGTSNSTPPGTIVVPTATTVSISITVVTSGFIFYAYQ